MLLRACFLLLSTCFVACSCRDTAPATAGSSTPPASTSLSAVVPPGDERLLHPTPYIPPQCYTKTTDARGRTYNPCFVCHQESTPPNYIDDAAFQLAFSFPAAARRNPWTNLFIDRREAIAAIPDEDVLRYVRQSNYFDRDGAPVLPRRLQQPPEAWDVNRNGQWDGWVPDIFFAFDARGFDRRPDGGYTGWRAFAYYPFPGTFWPTNGSFGDVMIRLPEPFRQREDGQFDPALYELNLALLEAVIARRDVPIAPTREDTLQVDLDGDGRLGIARQVRYTWTPGKSTMRWVGRARALQDAGQLRLTAGLFPERTELAHTVRYLDVVDGKPTLAARMKELRYMIKKGWLSYGTLELAASKEAREAELNPDALRTFGGSSELGIGNRSGWRMQAFIEDARGELRPQTREEHAFCIGCHSGVGAPDDSVFSFGRKLPASEHQQGWFHWSQRDLVGLREPMRADGQWEYTHYLQHTGAGDEFRGNEEVQRRFFSPDGALRPDAVESLHADISTLLLPSPGRALQLDKAYWLIVREQGFARGRDASLAPAENVHRELPLEEDLATGVEQPLTGPRRGQKVRYPGGPAPAPAAAPPPRKKRPAVSHQTP